MAEVKTFNYFGAIPGRATGDDNLTGLHFRVLMVIAGHDRMGRNGQCCWAGRKKLASRTNCHPSRLSSAISDLISFGYLEVVQGESDKRKRGYRVVYEAQSDALGIGIELKESRLRVGNLSGANGLRVGNLSPPANPGISQSNQAVSPDQPQTQYIQYKLEYKKEGPEEPLLSGERGRRFGADTHAELAERLGGGNLQRGWEYLLALKPDTIEWLEQRCSDGSLSIEDILTATIEARKVGAA